MRADYIALLSPPCSALSVLAWNKPWWMCCHSGRHYSKIISFIASQLVNVCATLPCMCMNCSLVNKDDGGWTDSEHSKKASTRSLWWEVLDHRECWPLLNAQLFWYLGQCYASGFSNITFWSYSILCSSSHRQHRLDKSVYCVVCFVGEYTTLSLLQWCDTVFYILPC